MSMFCSKPEELEMKPSIAWMKLFQFTMIGETHPLFEYEDLISWSRYEKELYLL